ncbi:hypothetical protein Q4F19_13770 [Sphingomonas sp. BIUV-7]|uniref:SGNH/GDSL hydrolase family protein n=1 Tax=Sphingomonas natans TaxID=3063330 RepID=A0ABT8YAU1_9SPHN|nr:hypothetical protein [Sphingomonas sp. BIUV-7]MDO6415456.1 hypothetical protein [Sphingomonas sp. BIUV-7]
MSCLIVGDCIALGIAAAMNVMAPGQCDVHARVGATSGAIKALVPGRRYDVAIISAGSNDPAGHALDRDLSRLRESLNADRISWVYPRSPPQAWSVYRVALSHGDRSVDLTSLASRDGVHPGDYRAAARLILVSAFASRRRLQQRDRQTVGERALAIAEGGR